MPETSKGFAPDVEHLQGNQRAQRRGEASHTRGSEFVVAVRHTRLNGDLQFSFHGNGVNVPKFLTQIKTLEPFFPFDYE